MARSGNVVHMAAYDPASGYPAALEQAVRRLLEVDAAAAGRLEDSISPVHLRALQALEQLGDCPVSRLAEALDVLPSTASRLSDRLTAAGLITRRTSPRNRRSTLLELTPGGRRVLAELVRARAAALGAVTEHMTDDERAALLRGARAFTAAHDRVLAREPAEQPHERPGLLRPEPPEPPG